LQDRLPHVRASLFVYARVLSTGDPENLERELVKIREK